MSGIQAWWGSAMIGTQMRHTSGRTGVVIGFTVGKKGKGLWFQVRDEGGVWCQYSRCK